jgi:hypothetical protein
MLVLRHRKKGSTNTAPIAEDMAGGGTYKEVYQGQPQVFRQPGNEMVTNANVWEMKGHGPSTPWELEAAQSKHMRGKLHEGKEAVVDPRLR